ncbi:MAG: nucleotide exchange factor GrpE [Actinobacteria bacterium]|nr:nucleotide exchange factor GrpE [Actinomycetota bacterium]
MSSEERQRREGEPSREEPPREELREEPRETDWETGDVSEPVEVGGSEDAGVIPESDDAVAPVENLAEEPSAEVVPDDEETPPDAAISEEPLEITQDEISTLADELETARRERDEYLDSMRRMKAELENSRKRQERERTRLVQLASERLVRELLPVLDNLERALEVEGDIREGVEATREQLLAVLEGEGLAPVASDGESFDPMVHEAVMGQPSEEHEEDTVIMTLERGYVLNGKPIRPAKVVVAK